MGIRYVACVTPRHLLILCVGMALAASGLAACGGGTESTATTVPRKAAAAGESAQAAGGAPARSGDACPAAGALAATPNAVLACVKQGADLVWALGGNRTTGVATADAGSEPGALPDGVWRCYLTGAGGGEPTDVWLVISGWTYYLTEYPGGGRKPAAMFPYARGTQQVAAGSIPITFVPAGWSMLGEYVPRQHRLFLSQPSGTRAPIFGQCN